MHVIGMEICPWHRDLSLKWVHYPFGTGIQILVPVSGNMFCIILCSHRVCNPSPNLNPAPVVEISYYSNHLAMKLREGNVFSHVCLSKGGSMKLKTLPSRFSLLNLLCMKIEN